MVKSLKQTLLNRILLVKTSSLGDIVHAMPAITDIRSKFPLARIDWIAEESLTALVRLHPGVNDVIPVAVRRWRRAFWRKEIRDDIAAFVRRVGDAPYDAIIDAQGLFKSALIVRAAHGPRYGLDFASSREPLGPFYSTTFRVPWTLHAIERNRLLVARALEYEVPARLSYGITAPAEQGPEFGDAPYAVLLHSTSGDYKLWPEVHWIALGKALNDSGLRCILPWGRPSERERSARIAGALHCGSVPPVLDFRALAGLLAGARVVIGVDTGLTHLAGALKVPTIGLYGATDPAATGLYGCEHGVNLGGMGKLPTVADVVHAVKELVKESLNKVATPPYISPASGEAAFSKKS